MSQRTATRLAWGSLGVSLVLYGLLETLAVVTSPNAVPAALHSQVGAAQQLFSWSFLPFVFMGALVASRQPRNAVGWLLCIIGLSIVVNGLVKSYAMYALFVHPGLPAGVWCAWLSKWLWLAGSSLLLAPLPLLFPDGKLISPRWRAVIWLTVGAVGLTVVVGVADPTYLSDYGQTNPTAVSGATGVMQVARALGLAALGLTPILSVLAVIMRYRRADFDQRHQLKWFAAAVALQAALLVPEVVVYASLNVEPYKLPIFNFLAAAALAMLPVSIGIAVLKYRLYDIDLVINKSLVYGALAIFITVVYVAIVVGLGSVIGTGGKPNLALSIFATAIVAVAFQPLRERLQHVANRLVYGRRATPYELVADFSDQMAGALSVEDVLPSMARAAATAVGASYGRVRLVLADGGERFATWPDHGPVGEMDIVLPAMYRGDRLGEIAVAKAVFIPADRTLLGDLAVQAGLVLHNLRLAIELQARLDEISARATAIRASRQRIVAAQDMERRRLEETIHEGAEAELLTIGAELHRAKQMLTGDAESASALLRELTQKANHTLESLRDVARGIYPPLLRERGLTAALRAQSDKLGLQADLASDEIDRYPAEVEAAVYFCCAEALRSAVGPVSVRLAATDSALDFCITATGLDLNGRVQDMEDRIEALGGNVTLARTQLRGSIPVPMLEPVR